MMIMLKTAFVWYTFLLVLCSNCAVRITVKECPVTEIAWKARSHIVTCKSTKVYHCIQNEEGSLMETCMIAQDIDPLYEDGCPWAYHDTERGSFLGSGYHSCQGNGCPRRNDSVYKSDQLYKYPRCLHHYEEATEAKGSTKSVLNVIQTTAGTGLSRIGDTEDTTVAILALLLTISVVVIIILFWRARRHKGKSYGQITKENKDTHIEETHEFAKC